MKSAIDTASTALPELPPNDVTAGIDRAGDDHALAIVDARGREIHRCTVEHTSTGLRDLIGALGKHGVGEVAIERPDGPVVDALLEAGPRVVVVSPDQVKNLRNVLPAVAGLFKDLDSFISLAFLTRFDTQDKIDWLPAKRLGDWLGKQGYTGRVDPAVLHQRILDAHADAHVFTSLPRSGRVLAARLLAEIGDCRARLPTPESLTCLAGAAPSTRQSGKLRAVGLRWSCDEQLRDAVVDFAADSRHANPWAADLYDRARARGHDHAHAVRILARAWPHVITHCWQDDLGYEPARHRALRRLLATQTAAA